MGEADKIVTPNYPVEKLPDELRRGIESGQMVRVTVEPEGSEPASPRHTMKSFFGTAPGLYTDAQDALDFIRGLRNESDR